MSVDVAISKEQLHPTLVKQDHMLTSCESHWKITAEDYVILPADISCTLIEPYCSLQREKPIFVDY